MSIVWQKLQTPAVEGGAPVRSRLLPYGHQDVHPEDVRAVEAVLRSEWLTTGPMVAEFEQALAAAVGAKHAVSFSSGTGALHGAAFAANLGPGDEAITTPLTFCATANSIVYQGARPVFADVSADTLNLDPTLAAARVTSRTRAIFAVDYAGHPCDLDALGALAAKNKLAFIEDACHALGAEYNAKRIGAAATMTVFSFHPVKHVTTGEGGMVTTEDEAIATRLRRFRNHGIDTDARQRHASGQWIYDMKELGYNYRLSDIACALGLAQLRRLDENLARRRAIAARYAEAFLAMPGVILPVMRPGVNPAWHLYPIRVDASKLRVDRAGIFRALRGENIGVNVHYIPVHKHSFYRERFGYQGGEYPVAEHAYEALISLPMFHAMTDEDVADVIAAVEKVLRYYAK